VAKGLQGPNAIKIATLQTTSFMNYTETFVSTWDIYMMLGTTVFASMAILIFLYHEYKVMTLKEYKAKYDYVILHEIKFFVYAVKLAVVAICFYANSVMTEWIMRKGWDWFLGRFLLMGGVVVVLYVFLSNLIRIYYPRSLEKRLHRLRNTPRTSPQGNTMRKLSEEEEDAHMEADQIAEEGSSIHSVDYDVWLDEKSGFKKIEKYFAYHHAEECQECGYLTLKILNEEVTMNPTQNSAGQLTKHYKCTFCNHRERRVVHLAKLSENMA
jgi:hypothetical protein